jgi:uncharacterized protein (TIGR02231 family)
MSVLMREFKRLFYGACLVGRFALSALGLLLYLGWSDVALAADPGANPGAKPAAQSAPLPEASPNASDDRLNHAPKEAPDRLPKITPSKIIAVTVLPEGAWITRQVVITREAGARVTLTLADLPPSVQQDSVQIEGGNVSITGPMQWLVLPVAQSMAYQDIAGAMAVLRRAQDQAEDALEGAQMRLTIFQAQMGAPNALVPKAGAEAGAFLDEPIVRKKFDQLLAQLIASQRAAQDDVNEIQLKINALNEKAEQLEAQGNRLLLGVPIKIHAPKNAAPPETGTADQTPVVVLVRYRVNAAGWQPVYRADLRTVRVPQGAATPVAGDLASASNAEIDWSLDALVHQTTEEDWSHVPLTLALQDSRHYTPVPKLPRWTIGFNTPNPIVPQSRLALAAPMTVLAASDALLVPQDTTGFNAEFKSSEPVHIQSGEGDSLIPLLHQTVAANAMVLIAPTLVPQAVLTGEFTLDNKIPLPAGQWQLFLNGAQIGQVAQAAIKPVQKQQLSFGVDQRIAVTFDQMPDQRDENGVIGKSSQLIRRSRITIQSQHTNPVAITVLMNVPVAVDADISVEPLSDNTPPTTKQYNGQAGVWAWSNQIKPEQKVVLNFGFRLRWPADKTLFGL